MSYLHISFICTTIIRLKTCQCLKQIKKLVLILQEEPHYQRAPGAPLPVLVTVFYEALCPDSKYFITKQLLPTYKAAAHIMEVQLVPYGKVKWNIFIVFIFFNQKIDLKAHTTTDAEGKFIFDCQHGPTECQANMYHACAAEVIDDVLTRLEVVTCMIRDNRNPKDAMQKVLLFNTLTKLNI